jgi:hypothetical protein
MQIIELIEGMAAASLQAVVIFFHGLDCRCGGFLALA